MSAYPCTIAFLIVWLQKRN